MYIYLTSKFFLTQFCNLIRPFLEEVNGNVFDSSLQMLYSLLPTCNSITCNHGGKCTQGQRLGKITCQCLPEVTVLPFIDDKCNVGKHDFDH